ncbi:hypothetical protein FBQ97_05815 [Acidobacteria bacterium ACD]|nr:hypothetical protein [Acidobacteria bacterium ACD]
MSRLALAVLLLAPGAGLAQRFETFPYPEFQSASGLAENEDGIYLFGSWTVPWLSLFRLDTKQFEGIPYSAPPGYRPANVGSACVASDGSLWGQIGYYLIRRAAGDADVTYPPPVSGPWVMPLGCRGTGEVWTAQSHRFYRYSADGRLLGDFSHPLIPAPGRRLWGCPDGNLWSYDWSGVLARLSPDDSARLFAVPRGFGDGYSYVRDLACSSDGGAWYTLWFCTSDPFGSNCYATWVVRLRGDGKQSVFETPEPYFATAIVEASDGTAWFTEFAGVSSVDDRGRMTHFKDAQKRWGESILLGRDGNLWFPDGGAGGLTKFVLPPFAQTVPALVGTRGASGVLYTSDLSVANWGSAPASVTLRYVPSRPASVAEEAVATVPLAPGHQLVLDDAFAWFRSKGFPIPETGNVGTLSIESEGPVPRRGITAIARTTSPSGPGRSGVAFPALWQESLPDEAGSRLRLFGLRQDAADRSNLALVNVSRTAPLRLAVTVFSGDGTGARAYLPDVFLAPGKWTQLDSVLAAAPGGGFSQGWAEVESLGEDGAPFAAYAVVNDNATNDGSYLAPSEPSSELILPALVDTGAYRSELVLANPDCAPVNAELTFAPEGAPTRAAALTLDLLEQRILPGANEALGLGPGVGPLLVRFVDERGRPAAGVASVRIATPDRYGVSLPGTPLADLKASKVRVAGLRQGNGVRSNLALVNAETDATLTLKVTVVDGETGMRKEPMAVTLPPLGFRQLDQVLAPDGGAQGWAEVERTATTSSTGSGRFLAYGVLNDGERPGEGTGDGSILPMATEK